MRLKICGLTHPDDVRLACLYGADCCGFVLAPSRRQVGLSELPSLVEAVPSTVLTVAVLVDPSAAEIEAALEVVDRVQLHGHEPPELSRRYGRRAWKAFRVGAEADLDALVDYPAGAYVLDSHVPGQAGGTGRRFPWTFLEGRRFSRPTFLAGGLCPENVTEALQLRSIQGLDVASGVEAEPGRKDPARLKRFLALARRSV